MTNDEVERLREQLRKQYQDTTETMVRSMRAWNDLLATSTDMAFDLVLKNWDYSRSLRGSAEQAVADAIRMQQRLSKEMLHAWHGYTSDINDLIQRTPPEEDEGKR